MQTRLRQGLVVLLVCAALMAAAAYSGLAASYTIAFSQSTMNHPWRVTLTNDMAFAAQKAGVELVWNDGQNDSVKQLANVEDLLAAKPDILIITPLQSKALTPVKDLAEKAGVPLIVIDREIEAQPGTGNYISFIGADQFAEGRAVGVALAEALKAKYGEYRGNVVEIQGTVGASATIERKRGFEDAISQYPDIRIVRGATQSGDYLRSNALSIMENYLQRFGKGEIDAVYAHNDEMALGALQAIEAAGRTELIGMIGSIDGQRDAIEALLDGKLAVVAQNPPYYGELAIQTALKYLNGESVPAVQSLPFKTFTAQTEAARREAQEYLNYLRANDLMY